MSLSEMVLGELTWTSGIAAPAVANELEDGHLDNELLALLEGCFGSNAKERFASFEPVIAALIAYYTSRFGAYPREKPQPEQLSSDETNNRAVSLADLGQNDNALLTLETALSSDPNSRPRDLQLRSAYRRLNYKTRPVWKRRTPCAVAT